MKPQAIIFLLAVVALTFVNTLNNGLIGDDRAIFTENNFYKDPANLKKIFRKEILTTPDQLARMDEKRGGYSGTVSYRPVTVLTFFVDGLIWKSNPVLLHLENLFLHLAVTAVAFFFVLSLTGSVEGAFLSALLFGVHPVQSEAVNAVGYRSDLLAALFSLAALTNFAAFREKGKGGPRLTACCAFFFLALFSKESAVMLPVIAAAYDLLIVPKSKKTPPVLKLIPYAGFAAVLVFYFWVYLRVFPTPYYLQASHLGKNGTEHVLIMVRVFAQYAAAILNPLSTKILPTLYAPAAEKITAAEIVAVAGFLLVALTAAVHSYRKNNRAVTFFTAWFFINYLPVSNVTPLLNPIAFRFLYLPLLGAAAVAAHYTQILAGKMNKHAASTRPGLFLKVSLIGICAAATIPNNAFFKNDFTASREMIRNFPDSSRPYWIMGLVEMDKKQYAKAKEYFLKYDSTDPRNPFITPERNHYFYQMLGRCEVDDPAAAIQYFKKGIKINPHFETLYSDTAKAYLLLGEYENSLLFARAAIALKDDLLCAYPYAVHSLIMTGELDEAEALLEKAETKSSPGDPNWVYLRGMLRAAKEGVPRAE